MTAVPLLDLSAQHASIRPELDRALSGVLDHGQFVNGPEVACFEEQFARYCGTRHAVGTSNGTDALRLALQAAGVGPGDEVVTSALTFIATVEAIASTGARPVLIDPHPDSALMTVARTEAAIGSATAAIVVVHLYGQPVDLPGFRELAVRGDLLLVEDAAQAHGACWDGRPVGGWGDLAAFSFFPGKNLGALGDAGAVTTDDEILAARVRRLCDHGRIDKYRHDVLGANNRLDTLQAAVLTTKLMHLDAWNRSRRAHAAAYDEAFSSLQAVAPVSVARRAESVYHWYVIRVADRDAARSGLAASGVASGIHYPVPLNRQPALQEHVPVEGFPDADRLSQEVLSLPVHPELSIAQRDAVIAAVAEYAAEATPVPMRAA